ncbi:cysteine--tRNA ligase [Rickettsiales endosymbiont of Peranema trichophorum]|uniref:cysteine--tRNA ligase n=1 Tax=Rickettsiales endosymbiont of Peranema trichophorum TaxID=2486577 RepID=UPI001F5DB486|nr:cysteine--tRNA ligase [Rickettsiales endosymbiont of Peranema trichophorum]
MISIYNTLTDRKDIFVPQDSTDVTMYVCGPTVYDVPHIGNARSAVVYDVLYRLLRYHYPKVTYVRNITDVDDKIIEVAQHSGESISSLTSRITDCYHQDLSALNCLQPTIEPKATEHIPEMIEMVETLIRNNNAYCAEGHVLFDISSYEHYGQLSKTTVQNMIAGARIEVAPFKKNPCDFVLWKPSKAYEESVSFNSPWSRGRPGWHLECSAMSKKYLGETFDIHGGGSDLVFPHHENELAQSRCATHGTFAQYFVHNGFLTVEGEKMSKSLGNFLTLRSVLNKGMEGAVLRYFFLTTHYRKPLNYTHKGIEDAKRSIAKFREALKRVNVDKMSNEPMTLDLDFIESLRDDINTPRAFALMHSFANSAISGDDNSLKHLYMAMKLLGFDLVQTSTHNEHSHIPTEVKTLADERLQLRQSKQWTEADLVRKKIAALGYSIEDTETAYNLIRIENHDNTPK